MPGHNRRQKLKRYGSKKDFDRTGLFYTEAQFKAMLKGGEEAIIRKSVERINALIQGNTLSGLRSPVMTVLEVLNIVAERWKNGERPPRPWEDVDREQLIQGSIHRNTHADNCCAIHRRCVRGDPKCPVTFGTVQMRAPCQCSWAVVNGDSIFEEIERSSGSLG